MQPFKLNRWLVLLFGVWAPVTAVLMNGLGMGIWEALGLGGAAGFLVVIITGILTGGGDPDWMMIKELDSGGKLN